jgi:hypothetical protein
MAFAAPVQGIGEQQTTLPVTWKPGFPRAVDIVKTIPAIERGTANSPKPAIVPIGNVKEATKVAVELVTTHPEQYITSVTKAGDVQVLNTNAVIEDIKTRMHGRGHATTVVIGNTQGALGIARRLKEAGFTASVSKAGYVSVLDPNAFADHVTGTMGKSTLRATNSETSSRQEAEAVAKAINERSNGDRFASVDGSKVDVINVAAMATYMYRCRNLGTGTIQDAIYTKQEAAAVTEYFNTQYSGQFVASVKPDGSFEVNRSGVSRM